MVGLQFVLSNHKVVKSKTYIVIDLMFNVTLLEEEQEASFIEPAPSDTVSLKLQVSFYRNQKQVYAEIEALQSNFNSYDTTLAMRFLESKINKQREVDL